jgi:hypothetical protein
MRGDTVLGEPKSIDLSAGFGTVDWWIETERTDAYRNLSAREDYQEALKRLADLETNPTHAQELKATSARCQWHPCRRQPPTSSTPMLRAGGAVHQARFRLNRWAQKYHYRQADAAPLQPRARTAFRSESPRQSRSAEACDPGCLPSRRHDGTGRCREPQIMSLSAHETPAAARVYVKRTELQRVTAARKRRQFVERSS